VAATNRPLNEMMASGAFRHDLFFRLRHFHINVPPLRDRGDDWRLIAEFYLLQLSQRYRVRKRLSSEASDTWPRVNGPGMCGS
jgi:transcriptional regulator with GAF, ATPase, and Fis domain